MIKKRDPKKSSKLGMDINDREIIAWNQAIEKVIDELEFMKRSYVEYLIGHLRIK